MEASDGPTGQEVACGHVGSPAAAFACEHVITDHDLAFARQFVGRGTESIWVCETCSVAVIGDVRAAAICEACLRDIAPMVGSGIRIIGEPQTVSRSTNLRFAEEHVPIEGLDARSVIGLAPVSRASRRWMAVTNVGDLLELDFSQRLARPITSLGDPARGLFGESSYPDRVQDKRTSTPGMAKRRSHLTPAIFIGACAASSLPSCRSWSRLSPKDTSWPSAIAGVGSER